MEYDLVPAVAQNFLFLHLNYKAGNPTISAGHRKDGEGSDLKVFFHFSNLNDPRDKFNSWFKEEQTSDILQLSKKYKLKMSGLWGQKAHDFFFFSFSF